MSRNSNLVKTIEIKDKTGRVIGTRDVVTYAGLLNLGHEEGMKRLDTNLLQFPNDENQLTAVFSAVVETTKGTFKSHGDANPENVTSRIVPHIIRMAETRAKARALRDAVNIGVVFIEELGLNGNNDLGENPAGGEGAAGAGQAQRRTDRSDARADRGTGNSQASSGTSGNGKAPMTEAQRRYLFRLLADRGIEDDEAHQHLKELFGVVSLKDVTKEDASAAIDQMVREAEEKRR